MLLDVRIHRQKNVQIQLTNLLFAHNTKLDKNLPHK